MGSVALLLYKEVLIPKRRLAHLKRCCMLHFHEAAGAIVVAHEVFTVSHEKSGRVLGRRGGAGQVTS